MVAARAGGTVEVYLGKVWSKQTVSQVERGIRRIDATELVSLALVFSATIAALLAPKVGRTYLEPEERIAFPNKPVPPLDVWRVVAPQSLDEVFQPFDQPAMQRVQFRPIVSTKVFPLSLELEDER